MAKVPSLDFIPFALKDWTYTIVIGFFVASYWRGTWTLLDIWLCQQPNSASLAGGDTYCFMVPALEEEAGDGGSYATLRRQSARMSYGIGLILLFFGVTLIWAGSWLPRIVATPDGTAVPGKVTPSLALVRFFIVYLLGASAVCLWRGIWYWADHWILVDNPLASYWTTSLVGSTVAFCIGAGASILAPPAIFLMDGPGANPPPIAVTILSSYYSVALPADEKPPKLPLYVRILDVIVSFIFLPFCVVWFWRGSWLVLDNYFWGFTIENRDVNVSLGWGTIFFVICMGLTSEPIIAFADKKFTNSKLLWVFGSLRTWILAWGTVSFWRVVWYIWDQFLPGPTYASSWISHVVGVVCLTGMGCVSSVVAPASTIGVDAVPHPLCADEPLFSMIPIPYETLYFMGIARQEWARKEDAAPPAVSSTADEGAEGAGEVELAPVDEDKELASGDVKFAPEEAKAADEEGEEGKEPAATTDSGTSRRGMLQSVRSWRPGPDGSVVSYHELQRPGLSSRTCSEYSQRPGDNNKRNRSHLFRSR